MNFRYVGTAGGLREYLQTVINSLLLVGAEL